MASSNLTASSSSGSSESNITVVEESDQRELENPIIEPSRWQFSCSKLNRVLGRCWTGEENLQCLPPTHICKCQFFKVTIGACVFSLFVNIFLAVSYKFDLYPLSLIPDGSWNLINLLGFFAFVCGFAASYLIFRKCRLSQEGNLV